MLGVVVAVCTLRCASGDMLLFGNLVKEIGANTSRLADAASGPIMNPATIFLGLTVGATMTAEVFLTARTLGIVVGGFLAFAISVAGGILAVKLYNLFSRKKINPLVGATGLSAVPMASRVANEMALKYDKSNHILQYCMASNVSALSAQLWRRRADIVSGIDLILFTYKQPLAGKSGSLVTLIFSFLNPASSQVWEMRGVHLAVVQLGQFLQGHLCGRIGYCAY